jgi:2-polyprenyl-3-methyl-5-hydroxy-6-metoxy-1,4-benzoquinol methylase
MSQHTLPKLPEIRTSTGNCRFCDTPLQHVFVDLGMSPPCESYVSFEQLNHMEPFYPLCVYVCEQCHLAQLQEYVTPEEIFSHYAYFSSYSTSWLKHAENYVSMISERLGLTSDSHVVELASNDGYLLQYFQQRGIPCTGIEPAANVAEAAIEKGIKTVVRFFGVQTATDLKAEGLQANLLLGNNVLAHVPDINDFVGGMKILLAPGGTITMEFPHLVRLMQGNQFDTIYHEHFSYLSITVVERIFAHHGLKVFDVDELSTHGGSLRIYATHSGSDAPAISPTMQALKQLEAELKLNELSGYADFVDQVEETKFSLLECLIDLKRNGKTIVGYGAPGKGNTLLNYCGIRTDLLDYTVDRNPFKHGKYLPGTHIPIFPPDKIAETTTGLRLADPSLELQVKRFVEPDELTYANGAASLSCRSRR